MSETKANIIMAPDRCLKEFNKKHWVVLHGNKVVVTAETHDPTLDKTIVRFLRPQEFRSLYENRYVRVKPGEDVPAADWWLAHSKRRQAKGVVFYPENKHVGYFNLWKGFSVAPSNGDCSRFLAFLKDVVCQGDGEAYAYLIGYFAHLIQRPWELPEAALVLVGEQGTGKSFAIKQFARLVSQHATTVSQRRHFVGGFNGHMANTILLIGDEVSIATRVATNAIKAPITEPTIMLEAKGLDAVPVKNCIRYVLITNDPHVALMDARERRFAVFSVSNAHQQDHEYFAGTQNDMDNGGLSGLMGYLQRYDLSSSMFGKYPAPRPSHGKLNSLSIHSINGYTSACKRAKSRRIRASGEGLFRGSC